jgi:chromosome partition protein MukB
MSAEKAKILLRKTESEVNAARECAAGLRTQYQGAEDQKRAFVPVFDALVRLNGDQPIEHRAAHSIALVVLAHHREMEEAVKAAQGIDAKVNDARRNAERQKQVRVLVAELAKRDIPIEDAESLLHVLEENRREISELDETVQQQIAKVYEERSEVSVQQTHIDHLNEALRKWEKAHELLAKLAAAGRYGVDTSEALRDLRRDIDDERRKVEQEIGTLQQNVEQLSKQISDLQEHGASLGTNLLRAADLTGGRPMAEIYDDVAIADAAKVEARIGPLVNAIVVQDVARAAKTLSADAKQSGRGVWLVQEDKLPEMPEGDFVGEMCAVEMGVATHLSPVPKHPVLGRAAREAEVARLREEQDQKQAQQGVLHQKLGELDSVIRITNDLFEYKECIGAESPEQQLNNAIDAKLRAERNVHAAERARQAAELRRVQKQDLRKQLESVNALAAFIVGVEWAEETTRLTKVMDEAARYSRILIENRIDHATLKKDLEVLRAVPLDEREMDALAKRIENLDREITCGNALIDDLLRFEECAPNLRFADQVELEQKESGGLATMEEQEGELVQAIEQVDKKLKQAKDTVNNKWDEFNKANSKLVEREAVISSLRGQLDELGVSADAASLEVASARFEDLKEALGALEKGQADTIRELGGVEQKVKGQLRDLAGEGNANSVLTLAQKAVKEKVRLSRDWDEFSRSMQSEDPVLWIRLQDPRVIQEYIGRGSYVTIQGFGPNLRKTLGDTLTEFGVEHVLPYSTGSRSPRDYLSDWLRVRHYIEQSLPRDITQSDDIEAAMEDMRNALARMRKQQQEQETKFRTSADSIANNINSMVRREIGQINRINNDRHLSEVRFGSITGVQIDAERDERMARFLDALRIEQDLFSNTDSLEDALAFVYQRNVGGTTNGAQLLDYRRYINIKIQVRRLGQNTWDSNLGTSSGEAIGVGAAILGVILDAMERQSEALQRRKIKGSIRFLMLDEANRLDTDSLEMMGSFCENMGTQLLVAAPQIDKARSGTTFCFVRRPTESGQEVEVSYRGRRGFEVEAAT